MRGAGSNPKTGNTVKRTGATRDKGQHNTRHTPPFNETTMQTEGGHQHSMGMPASRHRPFNHHATHHPQRHPTIHDSPAHHPRRGGSGQRIPHYTNTTDAHSPPTHHTPSNGTVRDTHCSTRQHCSGTSRARATPPHWAGQQQHTPPPFHTPTRKDTIHSSTHSALTHSRSHNR